MWIHLSHIFMVYFTQYHYSWHGSIPHNIPNTIPHVVTQFELNFNGDHSTHNHLHILYNVHFIIADIFRNISSYSIIRGIGRFITCLSFVRMQRSVVCERSHTAHFGKISISLSPTLRAISLDSGISAKVVDCVDIQMLARPGSDTKFRSWGSGITRIWFLTIVFFLLICTLLQNQFLHEGFLWILNYSSGIIQLVVKINKFADDIIDFDQILKISTV